MEQHETFGARLRRIRKQQRLSAVALAAQAGVSEGAIRAWETGRCEAPSLLVGLRIARALCEDPVYLAFGLDGDTFTASLERAG